MFPFEYCKIFKNTYFEEHLRTAAFPFFIYLKLTNNFHRKNIISNVIVLSEGTCSCCFVCLQHSLPQTSDSTSNISNRFLRGFLHFCLDVELFSVALQNFSQSDLEKKTIVGNYRNFLSNEVFFKLMSM